MISIFSSNMILHSPISRSHKKAECIAHSFDMQFLLLCMC
jgi:hypothetical protein